MIDLSQISGPVTLLVVFAVGAALGAFAIVMLGRMVGTRVISDSKQKAEQVIKDARSEAATVTKQAELDARNEVAKKREAFDREANRRRDELKEADRTLAKREDGMDRKLDTLAAKEKFLDERVGKLEVREKATGDREDEVAKLVEEQVEQREQTRQEMKQQLLRVTNMSVDEARRETLRVMEQDVQHEAAQVIQRSLDQAEAEAKENAQRITLQAIQRYAAEHTAESTVSAIPIPSDDMKGRVIGREGRNIRAFEQATGVDVIVDDTPGVVVVSCFDPVRRAIAADALRKLLEDGRIHPSRIEEIVKQLGQEMQQRLVKFGRDASIEVNIQGLHGRINDMMGRLHYRTSYGQNILRHSIEVAYLCQVIANELGLDGDTARRCGYLHDIGKAMDHEVDGTHPVIGMDFCKKFGEKEAVLNAVAGHHNDIPATTPYTPIVMAADAISGARPGARRETLEKYVKRLEQLESIATSMKGVEQAFAIQAGREVRVIVNPKDIDDTNCTYMARDIAKRVSEEMTFPGEIKISVLRELRTIEYAR